MLTACFFVVAVSAADQPVFPPLPLMEMVRIGTNEIAAKQLPAGLVANKPLGLIMACALHVFMPHRWQQVLHLTLKESALAQQMLKAKGAR